MEARNIPSSKLTRDASSKPLGQGSFGAVTKALYMGVPVAVKTLHASSLSDADMTEFRRETGVHAGLPHPHIVQLLGVVTDASPLALVMELLPQSLHQLLHSDEDLDWSERARLAREIAQGLLFLHEEGIIHRDLRSANVLLTADRRVKLCDFGLARVKATGAAVSGRVYAWMAPEVLAAPPQYSPLSDVFSYGVVVWEITSRSVPFVSGKPDQIVTWIRDGWREEIPEDAPVNMQRVIEGSWMQQARARMRLQDAVALLQGSVGDDGSERVRESKDSVDMEIANLTIGATSPRKSLHFIDMGSSSTDCDAPDPEPVQIAQAPPAAAPKPAPESFIKGIYVRGWGKEGRTGVLSSAQGKFSNPTSIAIHNNEVFVVDHKNYRVQVFGKDGGYLRQIDSVKWWMDDDASASKDPWGIAISPRTNEVFISQRIRSRIKVISLDGKSLRKFANKGIGEGQLNGPTAIALNPQATELFVCDSDNHRVQVFSAADGKFLRQWGREGKEPGQFKDMFGLAVSKDGALVCVSDWGESSLQRVQVFTPAGKLVRVMGGIKGDKDGQFRRPTGLAFTGSGTLLVCDSGNNRVQEMNVDDGTMVTTWGGKSERLGDFNEPHGIAVSAEGEVYVCEREGNRVQVFQ